MQFGGQPTPWSEVEIEGLRLRSVSQLLIQEIGAAGPENAEESARRACGVIQRMADQIVSADARIAELELECAQWRLELRIYRETENKRIAELERAVTVRDTEIARLSVDVESARHALMVETERMQNEINRIAQAHESDVEIRDTEISRLETDLELARRDAERINRLSAHLADDITICPPGKHGMGDGWLIFWQTGWDKFGQLGEETHGATLRDAIDAARAGNGGGV